jgi:N-acetylglucosaminyl-diphospho-decaprenol L-rhamnosyltransferase
LPAQSKEALQGSSAAFDVAVVVVSYAMPEDVIACLRALCRMWPDPKFEVFIAENGGAAAFDQLINALSNEPRTEATPPDVALPSPKSTRAARFTTMREDGSSGPCIHLAEMSENLGYAGGVNAWLRPLLQLDGWRGAWVLNPDTEPEPDALSELVGYAARKAKSMVGSRLVLKADRRCVQTRGLSWSRLRGTVIAIDSRAVAVEEPDVSSIEERLDAPSGASIYATRDLIDKVGPMREHYFLYFEDLEWGVRAKRHGFAVGYANSSIVLHKGGSTIGTAWERRDRSRLSVYLDLRNRLLFVREHHPLWLPWMLAVGLAEVAAFACVGAVPNSAAAFAGLFAGVLGKKGRPAAFTSLVRS